MELRILGDTVHPTNFRKLAKPLALCVVALFIVSMLTVFNGIGAHAATTPAVYTSGNQIKDINGNVINLRGVGLNGFAPALVFWGPGNNDNSGDEWQPGTTAMDQTFQALQQVWHVNMIRVFIYPSWIWQNNIVPSQETGYSGSGTSAISAVGYLQTVCGEAAKYGIYVDMVPYQLTPSSDTFGSDKYATPDKGGAQGLPFSGWDSQGQSFIQSTGLSEQQFWTTFWTNMANDFKAYPNAIFEAWNEPDTGVNTIPSTYMQYLTTMYSAIRGTGSTNLIMMQWRMGWFPNGWGMDLSWVSQINTALSNPTNIVYTFHLYYYAPSDLTSYWGTDYNSIYSALQGAWQSMGISAPLVSNEAGDCSSLATNIQDDYAWWNNICQATTNLGIGLGAYYWASPTSNGGMGWYDEALLSGPWQTGQSSPPPNTFGQDFINSNTNVTPSPIPTGSPVPSPTPTPTPIPVSNQELISNGGFENGVSPWRVITSDSSYVGSITQSTDAHSGSDSGLFTVTAYPGTGGYIALSQTLPAQVGQTYTLTFWYKNTFSTAIPHVFFKDSSGNDISYSSGAQMSVTSTWTSATITFGPIPSGTISTEIHFDVTSTGTMQLDDLTTGNGSPSLTPTPTPSATPTPVATPTPTPIPTSTPTPTPTPTAAPTPTSAPTPTPAPTSTPTPTTTPSPLPTTTPKPTSTSTPTPSPTPTPLTSQTGTSITTSTPTESPSPSPTSTSTPTSKPTPSPTATTHPSPTHAPQLNKHRSSYQWLISILLIFMPILLYVATLLLPSSYLH